MKRPLIIPFLFTLFSLNRAQAMDNEQKAPEQKQFSLCHQLKTIDPDASQASYEKLAQSLLDADLSTCECTWHLVNEKRQKAFKVLKDEKFLSDKSISRINAFNEKIKKFRVPNNRLIIHLPETFPDEQKKQIADHFSPNFSIKFKNNSRGDRLQSSTSFTMLLPQFSKNPIKPTRFVLFVPENFQHQSTLSRKSGLLHEEHHMVSKHSLLVFFLENEIGKKLYKHQRYPYEELNKIYRSLETEADLIPPACGSCEDAYSVFVDNFERYLNRSPKFDQLKNYFTHPSHQKRYIRAKRIYNLKVAEETLREKEEPQIL